MSLEENTPAPGPVQLLVQSRGSYLYLKEEPRVNRMALVLGCGWSNRRKKEWYSTQIFQKILHWSLLPIRNSSVSW